MKQILNGGTLAMTISIEELEKVNRVVVSSDHWCKVFYQDAEPKHGTWGTVYDRNGRHQACPYCGEWKYHNEQKFCGNCGARMDGEQNE